jgi:hypothetical protein
MKIEAMSGALRASQPGLAVQALSAHVIGAHGPAVAIGTSGATADRTDFPLSKITCHFHRKGFDT